MAVGSTSHRVRPEVAQPGRERRGDIQGLRAVAVLAVVAAHYGVPGLGGGFLGVDVFFVISGFLISGLLYAETARTGRVSLSSFYVRRARRIIPMATLVLGVTVIASAVVSGVVQTYEVAVDALGASLFVANVRFAAVGADYFAEGQGVSPLRHYWSLSVEEQFYVAWPLLLVGVLAVVLRRRSRRGRRRSSATDGTTAVPVGALTVVLGLLVAASFAWNLHLAATGGPSSYYSTPARVWELGVGALAALLLAPAARLVARRGVSTVLSLAGGGALLVAFVAPAEVAQGGGAFLLLPVLGTAALLVAGAARPAGGTGPAQRLLGLAPLRWVGDVSYSLYLWHWPLLILGGALLGPLSAPSKAVLVAVSLALSGVTYRVVEGRFHRARVPGRARTALIWYPASVGAVVTCSLVAVVATQVRAGALGDSPAITVANSGIAQDPGVQVSEDALVAQVQASVYAARRGAAIPSDLDPGLLGLADSIAGVGDCDYSPAASRDLCPRGDVDAGRSIVVLGDSHAQMWISAIDRVAAQAGYRAYYLVKPLCPAADLSVGSDFDAGPGPWPDCTDFREWALDQVARIGPDVTVVASAGPKAGIFDDRGEETSPEERPALLQAGWARTLDRLAATGTRPVLLRDTPWVARNPGACLGTAGRDLGQCSFSAVGSYEKDARASVRAAARAGVTVFDPRPYLCWEGDCAWVVGRTVTYTDGNHLTAEYAATLAGPVAAALELAP